MNRRLSEAAFTVAVLTLKDGAGVQELPRILGQVGARLDVLMLLECHSFDAAGQAQRFQVEQATRPFGPDRTFLTPSTGGPLHSMIVINSSWFQPITDHQPGLPDVFNDQAGALTVETDALDRPLVLKAVQWPYESGDARLDYAQQLTHYATPGTAAIIGGDLNSLWPNCRHHPRIPWYRHREHAPRWHKLPANKRHHKTLPPGLRPRWRHKRWQWVADRRATRLLAEAGFTSAGCTADDLTPTVTADVDHGQGQDARIDHILLSPHLAPALAPGSYRVWPHTISDHRLVTATIDLRQLDEPKPGPDEDDQ